MKTFNDTYRPDAATPPNGAQRALDESIIQAIGFQSIASQLRENDRDLDLLATLQSQNQTAANLVPQIYALRDRYAAQSESIYRNSSLGPEERKSEMSALAADMKATLTGVLGADAEKIFVEHSDWAHLINLGIAFSTDPRVAWNQYYFEGVAVFALENH